MVTASYIGAMCGEYRRLYLKMTQAQIAEELDISREAVSRFERGTLCNGLILFWFIQHGLFEWLPIEKWNGWGGAFNG